MKKKAIILLVSKETIPNFLFVKTFNDSNFYIFITSSEMENTETGNKRKWLIAAAGLDDESCDFIEVDAFKKTEIRSSLEKYNWNDFDEIIVNLTGGTKIMAIACYEFFNKKKAKIWYTPENDNSTYYLVDDHLVSRVIGHQATVSEYLKCRGINEEKKHFSEKKLTMSPAYTRSFFREFINGKVDKEAIESIRKTLRDNKAEKTLVKKLESGLLLSEKQFDENIGFDEMSVKQQIASDLNKLGEFGIIENGFLKKDTVTYLTGGWYEEYIYSLLTSKGIDNEYIKLGVVLNQKPKKGVKASYFTNNDLDVVFTNRNTFYVIECKSGGMNDKELFNKTAYTASALRKYFGLTAKTVLCTLSELTDEQTERAEILGITVFDLDTFMTENPEEIIYNKLKLF